MMNNKSLLAISVLVFFVLGTAATFWAAKCPEERSRLNPLMDYVPQEVGVYDTKYEHFAEADCRGCHGNSLADRHHALGASCTGCHPVPGVSEHDCRAAGCHATLDNGGHHLNDLSAAMQCDACHAQLDIGGYVPEYPPASVMPYPYSCENCHWGQALTTRDPSHPCTYDHYNAWGQYVGFYEYGKPLYTPQDLHHNFESNFVGNCYWCHAQDYPENLNWDPDDDRLVKYCEKCHGGCAHSVGDSGLGYYPHLGLPEEGFGSWEAVGWHVESSECGDVDPIVYRLFKNGQPEFPADELCWGCHGDRL